MGKDSVRDCVAHIRAAADVCEKAEMFEAWAALLTIADQLLETAGLSCDDQSR